MKPPCEWQHSDANGLTLPWYTRPMLDVLVELPIKNWRVFEYGGGCSTVWYGHNCREVVTVESDRAWVEVLHGEVTPNVSVICREEQDAFVDSILVGDKFDLIVVDGAWRELCTRHLLSRIKPGGMVILDNAERWHILGHYLSLFRWNEHRSYPQPRHPDWRTDCWIVREFERWNHVSVEKASRLERERRAALT